MSIATEADERMNILVVDDRAEQRLSLAAAIADLGENIVQAASGREALRELLRRDFAVILLDVNMPGLDGFETAEIIRQRTATEHTPIIFITAYSDDTYALRGYSLGAVDYVLAPVEPQVLRTKVGVFVDLFKKNQEVNRQAAVLRHRATQLRKLTEASLAISAERSIECMLQLVTERASAIIGAKQAVLRSEVSQNADGGRRIFTHLSYELHESNGHALAILGSDVQAALAGVRLPARITQADIETQLDGLLRQGPTAHELPMRGWLAAPIHGRDGRNLGVLQLSDKISGEFNEDDQAILVQLAEMAALRTENILYSQEHEANRLKDEFLSTLSHELRTPLQAMFTWTRMLRMREKLDPGELARGLEVIERSANAQAKLIEELLDVSRIINNKLCVERSPLDLVKALDAAADAARPMANASSIEIVPIYRPVSCHVSADPNRLQQILWNLLSNAVKFTPKGGRVEVRLEESGSFARIRISDTGRGIAPDFLPYIFERFRQADSSTARAQGGLGIGLFVVRRLVELHGGSVRAESAGIGSGATFTVDLPLLDGVDFAPMSAAVVDGTAVDAQAANGLRLDGVRVLVVDDEDDVREALVLALQEYGAEVTSASSAAAALIAIDQARPQVLLCDVGMPEEDGYALIRKVRARANGGRRLPAAAVTAYARSEDGARALAAGFDAHVSKPADPIVLASAVKNLLYKSESA